MPNTDHGPRFPWSDAADAANASLIAAVPAECLYTAGDPPTTDTSCIWATAATCTLGWATIHTLNILYLDILTVATGVITRVFRSQLSISGVTLTVVDHILDASDEFLLCFFGPPRAYDAGTDSNKGFEISPVDSHYVDYAVDVDTTNVGAGPTYYPSSTGLLMNGAKSLSFTGKMIEGDAEDNTLTVQVMNDEDTVSGDWQTVYFYDNIANAWAASYGCNATTTQMAASLDNLNFTRVRFKFVGGASATNTLIIKARSCAL